MPKSSDFSSSLGSNNFQRGILISMQNLLKLIYSKKATKFKKNLPLGFEVKVKTNWEIFFSNYVAFSKNLNLKKILPQSSSFHILTVSKISLKKNAF